MLLPTAASAFRFPFLGTLHGVTEVGSTEPGNQDKNPYGIVTVPRSVGALVRGDILISNFNNEENLQGTGTTLVQLTPRGSLSLFAQINAARLPGSCPGGVGLTTALTILPDGYVVVGSLPSVNGQAETAEAGCLIVLNPNGKVVSTISGAPINGPWEMTSVSGFGFTALFVTNVLNGAVEGGETPTDKGSVVRIILGTGPGHAPQVISEREIATGFPEETNSSAFVLGPTGVALGETALVCGRHRWQPHRSGALRAVPAVGDGRGRHHGHVRWAPQQPAGDDARAQRRHPHDQRRRWQHRRDHALRDAVRTRPTPGQGKAGCSGSR